MFNYSKSGFWKIYILTLFISIFRTTKNSGTGCLLFIQNR